MGRAIGFDPGAPRAHYAVTERVDDPEAEGPRVRLLAAGSIEWRGRPGAEREIADLLEEWRPERCAVEAQFLHYGIFSGEAREIAQKAGAYFNSLAELAQFAGAVGAIWARFAAEAAEGRPPPYAPPRAPCAWSVPHGTWKALLAPCRVSDRDSARSASLALGRLLAPLGGSGKRPAGAWLEGDHDRAAALCLSLVALGVGSATSILPAGQWPPSGAALTAKATRKKRTKKSKPPAL